MEGLVLSSVGAMRSDCACRDFTLSAEGREGSPLLKGGEGIEPDGPSVDWEAVGSLALVGAETPPRSSGSISKYGAMDVGFSILFRGLENMEEGLIS